ncbi:MAG TPA: SGNH/GDSL hydrolase family protein [Dyella sp.]|uniref:SGNH/GDSL hydrolase family protein n=1 Tax=Dyella sp. TaxID=1869338 RepID=UPI002C919F77|nr:SGNH/GDSL hydrolase family protein [Dyella sp.]HTV85534.1 SGNH/GDSL hydrolase family protein [Dyella sp.]
MKILLSLLLALVPCLASAAWAPHQYWEPAIKAFEASDRANPPPQGAVLFIGSSSIEHWKSVAADFPEVKVINRGFGGSELGDSTYFADRIVAPYHPRAIVLYAGDNDVFDGRSPREVRDELAAFVTKVRSEDPGVPIAFISIKPSMARKMLLPQIRQANALVRDYAAKHKGVTYLDTFTPMLGPDGQPQWKWFGPDGLHMNRSGYVLWISIIKPWVDAHAR